MNDKDLTNGLTMWLSLRESAKTYAINRSITMNRNVTIEDIECAFKLQEMVAKYVNKQSWDANTDIAAAQKQTKDWFWKSRAKTLVRLTI